MWDPDDASPSPAGTGHATPGRRAPGTQLLQLYRLLLQEEGVLGEAHHRVRPLAPTLNEMPRGGVCISVPPESFIYLHFNQEFTTTLTKQPPVTTVTSFVHAGP